MTRSDSGVLTTYTFGPLRSTDNGTTLSCYFIGSQSANATIYITRKSLYTYAIYFSVHGHEVIMVYNLCMHDEICEVIDDIITRKFRASQESS